MTKNQPILECLSDGILFEKARSEGRPLYVNAYPADGFISYGVPAFYPHRGVSGRGYRIRITPRFPRFSERTTPCR